MNKDCMYQLLKMAYEFGYLDCENGNMLSSGLLVEHFLECAHDINEIEHLETQLQQLKSTSMSHR